MVALSPAGNLTLASASVVRKIGLPDLTWALAGGWRDFREMRGDILILGLIYPAVGLLAAALSVEHRLFPLLFPLVAGLAIVGPAVASGFFELAKRRSAGEDTGWAHFFDPFRRPSGRTLAALSLLLAVLFVAWVGVAWAIYDLAFGPFGPSSPQAFLHETLTTPHGWAMVWVGNLMGLAFAAAALAISVVAFPIAVDGRAGVLDAVAISLRACAKNPLPVAVWGALVAALLVVACIPLFVGLAVVLPVLGYASWRLYTRLIDWNEPVAAGQLFIKR
jgi:uncharacterized membrane protein